MSQRSTTASDTELIAEVERLRTQGEELSVLRHDLEVHQEELHGQLNELRATRGLLEASRDEYAELYDDAPVAYLTLSAAGIIAGINLTGCSLLEVQREKVLQLRFMKYVDSSHRRQFLEHMRQCRSRRDQTSTELILRSTTGRKIPTLVVSRPKQNNEFRTIIFDRTEQYQLDQMVRQLNARLVAAQEDERRRIARELHDEMGQLLAALILDLKAIEETLPESSDLRARLRHSQEVASNIGREVHDLALELRPTALDDLGLEAALRQYVGSWSARTRIQVDYHARGLSHSRLPSTMETALYRVIQEALTNVARHSGATRVNIVLERRRDLVIAIVEDNGKGFPPERLLRTDRSNQRLGLLGMRERLDALGGTLEIESRAGQGATIYARVSIPRGAAQHIELAASAPSGV